MDKWTIQPFNFKALPSSQVRDEWLKYRRNFKYIALANEETDQTKLKNVFLARAGPDVQEVFSTLPGADVHEDEEKSIKPFDVAIEKLDEYFAPQQHEIYERHVFWTLKPEPEETLERFLLRATDQAAKCNFGKTKTESAEISVIDKIILLSPPDLKEKLLQQASLTLDGLSKTIKSYSSVKFQAGQIGKAATPSTSFVNKLHTSSQQGTTECSRCGWTGHFANDPSCPALGKICDKCGRADHFAKRCKTVPSKRLVINQQQRGDKPNRGGKRPYNFPNQYGSTKRQCNAINSTYSMEASTSFIYSISTREEMVGVTVGGVLLEMMIDSGSSKNIIAERTWCHLIMNGLIMKNQRDDCELTFRPYGLKSEPLKVLKVFDATTSVEDAGKVSKQEATFYVVAEGSLPILGRETVKSLGVLIIGLPSTRGVSVSTIKQDSKHFPKIRGVKLCIPIDKEVSPVAQRARRPPLALMSRIEEKLDALLAADIIEPVTEYSQWISPLVAIVKDNGELRLCVDMRRANTAVLRETHYMPTFEDFLPTLKEARFFSRLDVKEAFHQVELEESSRYITTFITHKGVFRYKRLLFGISCASEMYQKIIEQILADCGNVVNYIDDILIFGATEQEHDASLQKVLKTLQSRGVLLNDSKCVFKVPEVEFLGHHLSAKGIRPTEEKTEILKSFRAPSNVEELRSFLGMVTYIGRFLPDHGTVTNPLRELTRKGVSFDWTDNHEHAFQQIKMMICEISNLHFFDNNLRTRLVADASPVALGAVLLQFTNNDQIPRIISYASKSLSDTEKRYCQTEKEALALVWAVEKFAIYLLGRKFELETDHEPLEVIFSSNSKPCARIERWVLRLQSFVYEIKYRKGSTNVADPFSRLVEFAANDLVESEDLDTDNKFMLLAILESVAVDVCEIENISQADPELLALREAIQTEKWDDPAVKSYALFRAELGVLDNIVVRGTRMIVPATLRPRLLSLAHEGHPGESVMLRRLRDRVWWPLMEKDVQRTIAVCEGCRLVGMPTRPEPMERRSLPCKPWVDIALDFLGPLPTGEYLLVVIDYYSRYKEIEVMTRITAKETTDRLERIFTRLGYPVTITLDNARQFICKEFEEFCTVRGIHLNNTTPYWPQENGLVERQNRSLLKRLKISHSLGRDWKTDLNEYLMMYYTTPHTVTGKTPSELCFGRTIRSKLPSLQDIETTPRNDEVYDKDMQAKQKGKEIADLKRRAAPSNVELGDMVLLKNLLPQNKLSPNFLPTEHEVMDKTGARVTVRNTETGRVYQRNSAHLKRISNASDHRQAECEPEILIQEQDVTERSMIQAHGEDDNQRHTPMQRPRRRARCPKRFEDFVMDSETSSLREKGRCGTSEKPLDRHSANDEF